MNKTLVFTTLIGASVLSLPATAAAPNWNKLEISHAKVDIDGLDEISLKGYSAEGSALIAHDVFLQGQFTSVSDTFGTSGTGAKMELQWSQVSLGYRYSATSSTDVYAALSYEAMDVSASTQGFGYSEDEKGYGLTAGVRSMLTDKIEAKSSLSYMDIGDGSDTALEIGSRYYFTPAIAAGASYLKSGDLDVLMLTARSVL